MKYRVKHCPLADDEHKKSRRQYAHTFHRKNTICTADAFEDLPEENQLGILLHELGHLEAGAQRRGEAAANDAILQNTGIRVEYKDSPHGRRLERIADKDKGKASEVIEQMTWRNAKRNPETSEDLYKTFHGRAAAKDKVIELDEGELQADYNSHPDLAKLGDGVSLTCGEGVELTGKHLNVPKPAFDESDCWATTIELDKTRVVDVAGVPGGKQIYFVKGDQDISAYLDKFPVDPEKELIDLGPCLRIEYFAQKKFDAYQPTIYFHCFGEESGQYPGDEEFCPSLLFNRVRKKLYLVGGVYTIKSDGIID
jgi:hypothetical protein